jgi:hypothetical protein
MKYILKQIIKVDKKNQKQQIFENEGSITVVSFDLCMSSFTAILSW